MTVMVGWGHPQPHPLPAAANGLCARSADGLKCDILGAECSVVDIAPKNLNIGSRGKRLGFSLGSSTA